MPECQHAVTPELHRLQERLKFLQTRIDESARKSGRDRSAVTLVAVTKTVSADVINGAVSLGLTDLGENRLQEAAEKRPHITAVPGLRHHMIGHLQTNKAKRAVELFDLVQSLDRVRLVTILNRLGEERGTPVRVLLEVKVGHEETKTGCPIEEAPALLAEILKSPGLSLEGLMTIAPLDLDEAQTRLVFRRVAGLFNEQKQFFGENPILSMGMTDDFEWAIEEGSTMVRLGRALFGERELA